MIITTTTNSNKITIKPETDKERNAIEKCQRSLFDGLSETEREQLIDLECETQQRLVLSVLATAKMFYKTTKCQSAYIRMIVDDLEQYL